jgi:hypothetical protein
VCVDRNVLCIYCEKNRIIYIYLFHIYRLEYKCYDSCPFNYHNKTGQTGPDFVCEPKACVDRVQYDNKSCSMMEDFSDENNILKCYSYGNMCSEEIGCPLNTNKVYFVKKKKEILFIFIFFFFFLIIEFT